MACLEVRLDGPQVAALRHHLHPLLHFGASQFRRLPEQGHAGFISAPLAAAAAAAAATAVKANGLAATAPSNASRAAFDSFQASPPGAG